MATGGVYNCAVRSGRVYCWGLDRNHGIGEVFEVDGMTEAVEVAAGYSTACTRTTGGAVTCWNEYAKWPIEGISDAISIAVGQSFACAAQPQGVKCWSPNFTKDQPPAPQDVYGVEDPIQVAAGFYHACALERAGTVKCWGADKFGELGTQGPPIPNFDQGTSNGRDWVGQAIDHRHAELDFDKFWAGADRLEEALLRCVDAIGGGGELRAIEFELLLDAKGVVKNVELVRSELDEQATPAMERCAAKGYLSAPPIVPASRSPTRIGATVFVQSRGHALRQAHPVMDDAVAIASRGYFSCAVASDGSLKCWGITHAFDGPGIHGTRLESPGRPSTVERVSGLETISIGWRHACGRRRDGSHICFGGNGEGTFGAGVRQSTEYAVRRVDSAGQFTEISAGPTLSCGRKADGSVWCWGINDGGRLGVGRERGGIHPPAPVKGPPGQPDPPARRNGSTMKAHGSQ